MTNQELKNKLKDSLKLADKIIESVDIIMNLCVFKEFKTEIKNLASWTAIEDIQKNINLEQTRIHMTNFLLVIKENYGIEVLRYLLEKSGLRHLVINIEKAWENSKTLTMKYIEGLKEKRIKC